MKRSTGRKSAAVRAPRRLAMKENRPNESLKMTNLRAAMASGSPIARENVFNPQELEPHGNPIERIVHVLGTPLSRWLLIFGGQCVTGEVHRADGPAAGDGDTNFELVFPKLDPNTGGLSEPVTAINASIDNQNQTLPQGADPFVHIEDNKTNWVTDDGLTLGIHCEVDPDDLATFKGDLAGMVAGDLYTICGFLVVDTAHPKPGERGLYEIHPVKKIDKVDSGN